MQVVLQGWHRLHDSMREFFTGSGEQRMRYKRRYTEDMYYHLVGLMTVLDEAQDARDFMTTNVVLDVESDQYKALQHFINFIATDDE
ncbi:MAG: hypothetical protein ACRCWQ_04430 [Bacilli bacterium]